MLLLPYAGYGTLRKLQATQDPGSDPPDSFIFPTAKGLEPTERSRDYNLIYVIYNLPCDLHPFDRMQQHAGQT